MQSHWADIKQNTKPKKLRIMTYRETAATFVLCNDDIKEALLELLDNASSVSDTIPDEIIVWEKFENDPLENIVEYIDTIEQMLVNANKEGAKFPNGFDSWQETHFHISCEISLRMGIPYKTMQHLCTK